MTARQEAPGLRVRRLSVEDWFALGTGVRPPLGGLAYGSGSGSSNGNGHACDDGRAAGPQAAPDGVPARDLFGGPVRVDAWSGGEPRAAGRCGSVRWRHDGRWLYGALELDEARTGLGLAELTAQAYRDIFATLRHTGCPHLLRLWNYLPRINADGGGLERYRQFNAARQQAFLDAGQRAFEGAPAACALGTREGPFSVRFLAGTKAPLALENPRQVPAYRYPSDYGPRAPSFSRAALLDAGGGLSALLISGTASIVGHASRHAGDVAAQTHETLANLQALLDAAHARGRARFALPELECTVYLRHAADAPRVRTVLEAALGTDAAAVRSAVYLQADICRADLLVEIEAHAFAPGLPHADAAAEAAEPGAVQPIAERHAGPHEVPA